MLCKLQLLLHFWSDWMCFFRVVIKVLPEHVWCLSWSTMAIQFGRFHSFYISSACLWWNFDIGVVHLIGKFQILVVCVNCIVICLVCLPVSVTMIIPCMCHFCLYCLVIFILIVWKLLKYPLLYSILCIIYHSVSIFLVFIVCDYFLFTRL